MDFCLMPDIFERSPIDQSIDRSEVPVEVMFDPTNVSSSSIARTQKRHKIHFSDY
jgi:hypothetical protein